MLVYDAIYVIMSLRNTVKLISFMYTFWFTWNLQTLINSHTKFYAHLRWVKFVNEDQEHISFDQSILLIENINKRKEIFKLHSF